jgi:hypothetical protein
LPESTAPSEEEEVIDENDFIAAEVRAAALAAQPTQSEADEQKIEENQTIAGA